MTEPKQSRSMTVIRKGMSIPCFARYMVTSSPAGMAKKPKSPGFFFCFFSAVMPLPPIYILRGKSVFYKEECRYAESCCDGKCAEVYLVFREAELLKMMMYGRHFEKALAMREFEIRNLKHD